MKENYLLLASNTIGVVVLDKIKQQVNIGIGTILLSFKKEDAVLFADTLERSRTQLRPCERVCEKDCGKTSNKVFIQTPMSNMLIALSERELKDSLRLLEWAILRLEVYLLVGD